MFFESKKIPSEKIKTNGKIKKTIDAYSKKKVPMRVMLTDFLAVKSKADVLAAADNPWAYFYKGVQGYEVESGVSHEETLFRFSAMTLKDQLPSDVINAAFYSNRVRNDSDFELGYLLPLFLSNVNQADRILFVNPSPDIICHIEENHSGKKFYAVADSTVAALYRLQFPESVFLVFDEMNTIEDIDAVCITNRDQKLEQAQSLLKCLLGCSEGTKIMGLVPCAWFDNPQSGAYTSISKSNIAIKQILIVDSKVTMSTPRRKMILAMEKGKAEAIEVFDSTYDEATRQFSISENGVSITTDSYLKTNKTILSCLKAKSNVEDRKAKYNKAEEYKFSEEISIFYKVYPGRKNKYAGVAHYREIEDINLKTWGRKLSANVERGLRADTREAVLLELERIVFADKIYPIIRNDLKEKYIIEKHNISLKSLWFYLWNYLSDMKKYNHEYAFGLFKRGEIADIMPMFQNGNQIIKTISVTLGVEPENIPYIVVEQIELVLQLAVKQGILVYDPLEMYVSEYINRATERQQDVRNALVKKHFTTIEEEKIVKEITKERIIDGEKCLACTQKSLLLAVGIRLFTGMAIREVAALKWKDFRAIEGTEAYQFVITKFVDSKGKIKLHSERENWKRFRIIPSAKVLSYLLFERKKYLLGRGVDEEYLMNCPIILQNECISNMKNGKEINHCRPDKISGVSNELIQIVNVPENEIILPDERGELITDLNRYHGDIFLSNFRHKANHLAYLTIAEINYMIGIDAPDTFSRHYCDYSNDFPQKAIIQKLSRWVYGYENMVMGIKYRNPSIGSVSGSGVLEIGPFSEGVASVDLLIKNDNLPTTKISAISTHGIKVNKTVY